MNLGTRTLTAIGYVTCNHCGDPLDPETLRCDCRDDCDDDPQIDPKPVYAQSAAYEDFQASMPNYVGGWPVDEDGEFI